MNLIGLIGAIGVIFGAKTLDFPNAENQLDGWEFTKILPINKKKL